MTAIDAGFATTKVKKIVMYYPSITQIMVEAHCEILWADNYGANLGCHPTENYAAGLYDAEKKSKIAHKHFSSRMLGLWIKNSLTIYAKRKLRYLKYAYTFNVQVDGFVMLFVIIKMVQPGTLARCSDIKSTLNNTKMPHIKHETPKANLQILEYMNEIFISGETYP